MNIILPIGFFAFLFFYLWDLWIFNQLLSIEHKKHRKQWVKDGKPITGTWKPKGAGLFEFFYNWNGAKVYYIWTFKTPELAKKDKTANKLIREHRLFMVGVFMGLLLIVLLS
jgi:hypothetical protein